MLLCEAVASEGTDRCVRIRPFDGQDLHRWRRAGSEPRIRRMPARDPERKFAYHCEAVMPGSADPLVPSQYCRL
jgi:hypothetical protein